MIKYNKQTKSSIDVSLRIIRHIQKFRIYRENVYLWVRNLSSSH